MNKLKSIYYNYKRYILIKKLIAYKTKLKYKWILWFHNMNTSDWSFETWFYADDVSQGVIFVVHNGDGNNNQNEMSIGFGNTDEINTPDIFLMLSEELVVFDNLRGTISFIINVDPREIGSFKAAQARLDALQDSLKKPVSLPLFQNGATSNENKF